MWARSSGDRMRRSSESGPLIGPAKNVRSLTSQMRRPCRSKSRHAAPAPVEKVSMASSVPAGASWTSNTDPSVHRYRICGSRRTRSTSAPATCRRAREVVEHVRERQQRRTDLEREAVDRPHGELAAESWAPLQERDAVPGDRQPDGSGHAADTAADDDDLSHDPDRRWRGVGAPQGRRRLPWRRRPRPRRRAAGRTRGTRPSPSRTSSRRRRPVRGRRSPRRGECSSAAITARPVRNQPR